MQTVEARFDFKNRTLGAIRGGAQYIQTSFPDVSQLPKYAYSFPGTSNVTVFPTNYTVSHPQFCLQDLCSHHLIIRGLLDCQESHVLSFLSLMFTGLYAQTMALNS